ncbi:serine/threonine-protein phosphatase 6 regulatory ankyrin repeat subunit C-like [Bacillus rossius redtenbacheri]|uniref:serine/threonine-protein phosphatase 6 regulatory ankyrin repeat subunit C-like n=1 Tax=Bacillus rossius redtenbacheri TaxID=93214 RepID=UPI002FDEB112
MLLGTLTSLLVLCARSAGEDCDSPEPLQEMHVVTALQAVGGALSCLKDILQESLRSSNESNHNLERMVLELRDEVRNLKSCEYCNTSKLQDLERKLSTSLAQVEGVNEKVKRTNNMAESLGTNFNTSLEQIIVPDEKKNQSNNTSRTHKKYQDVCERAKKWDITTHVEEFGWSKDWRALRLGLEAALSNASVAYKQLQRIQHDRTNPLWTVGEAGYAELAVLLLCGGLPVAASDADRDGMLHGAAWGGQAALAALLLDEGADTEVRGLDGRTPLVWAVENDSLGAVRLLAERGAALNASKYDGDTALHVSVGRGNMVIARYLVEKGANTTAPGKDGWTPLDVANRKHNPAMIKYLLQFPH